MSELRYNPFLDDWVIISSNRQARPNMPKDYCPFCPGSGKVPDNYEVFKYDNDFPVMKQLLSTPEAKEDELLKAKGIYGKCEVILYHPGHTTTLPELPVPHIKKLVDLWCERFNELKADPKIKYIMIFENRGKEVGVTMPHPHGQLYAYGWIPKTAETEIKMTKKYFDEHKSCLMCDMLKKELELNERIVFENDSFAVIVPFFTPWPYGTYIIPKKHMNTFSDFTDKDKNDLADALKKLTGAYDSLFDYTFPYMMCIHQSPVNSEDTTDSFHFHIEFYPPMRSADKQYFRASSETGAGAYCNVSMPEEKAKELKAALDKYIYKNR